MDNEIEIRKEQETQVVGPESLIAAAIAKKLPVETIERLLAMAEKIRAAQAKIQFDEAMSAFQGECPTIQKTKSGGRTKSGTVAYMYAPLDAIVQQVKPILKKNGFSYSIQSTTNETGVSVTCVAKHKAGHSEPSTIDIPFSTKTEIMSAPQVVMATMTFAKRYAFCNAFGIMTGDEDTDANDIDQTTHKAPHTTVASAKVVNTAPKEEYPPEPFSSHSPAQTQPSATEEDGETCTACGKGTYKLRKGTRGAFYGCSNYPNCTSTKDLMA